MIHPQEFAAPGGHHEPRESAQVRDREGKLIPDPLERARSQLEIPDLLALIKRGTLDAIYDLLRADGTLIPLGPMSTLRDPVKVADLVGNVTNHRPRLGNRDRWNDTVNCLLHDSVRRDEESVTPDDITRAWIDAYSDDRLYADRDEAIRQGEPFREENGPLHIGLRDLHRYVTRIEGLRIEERELAARLRRIGYRRVECETTKDADTERVRRGYYVEPADPPSTRSPHTRARTATDSREAREAREAALRPAIRPADRHGDDPDQHGDDSETTQISGTSQSKTSGSYRGDPVEHTL